jgi:uncharacterized membrane protein required for colicin V production
MGNGLHESFGFIVDVLIVVFLIGGIIVGYKKGFFENTVRLIGSIIALLGAYLLKNPLSVYLYTKLPFFKLPGVLEGVSSINIICYELISFIIVWILISIVLAILAKIFKIEKLTMTLVTKLRIPNKVLGVIVGFIESYLFVYFAVMICMFVANLYDFKMEDRLANYVFETPVLHEIFGPTYSALTDITLLAQKYENINDKMAFNAEAVEILIKYDLVSEENVELLIEQGKIQLEYKDE